MPQGTKTATSKTVMRVPQQVLSRLIAELEEHEAFIAVGEDEDWPEEISLTVAMRTRIAGALKRARLILAADL